MKLFVYSVLRLLVFIVPFAIMMLFPILRELWWLAAIFAALIGFSLSIIFLRKPLNDASSEISARRDKSTKVTDEDVEDAAVATADN